MTYKGYLKIVLCFSLFAFHFSLIAQRNYKASPDSVKKEMLDLDKVFAADTVNINVDINMCFGGGKYNLLIVKGKGMYKFQSTYVQGKTNEAKSGKLPDEELQQVKKLFQQGVNLDRKGIFCTTNKYFTAEAKNIKVPFSDDRCNQADDYLDKLRHIVGEK
ncbi:MAG: hypothetical protein ACLQQ4_14320 [Bacteroidia bacterium]